MTAYPDAEDLKGELKVNLNDNPNTITISYEDLKGELKGLHKTPYCIVQIRLEDLKGELGFLGSLNKGLGVVV